MKKVAILTVVIMLVAAVGVGVATAKQDENPGQAGKSSIYFYDVVASDTHGKGKLMIDLNKHTFVFNGQGFDPSAQISLKARAEGSTDYVLFARGKATPSGNLHIAGTWEPGAAPADVVGATAYQQIFGMWLSNWGAFRAKIACYYSTDGGATWTESAPGNVQCAGCDDKQFLSNLNVPDFSLVKIHVVVEAGNDRTGSQVFEFVEGLYPANWAYYSIDGTTLNNDLSYHGILTLTP